MGGKREDYRVPGLCVKIGFPKSESFLGERKDCGMTNTAARRLRNGASRDAGKRRGDGVNEAESRAGGRGNEIRLDERTGGRGNPPLRRLLRKCSINRVPALRKSQCGIKDEPWNV